MLCGLREWKAFREKKLYKQRSKQRCDLFTIGDSVSEQEEERTRTKHKTKDKNKFIFSSFMGVQLKVINHWKKHSRTYGDDIFLV